MEEYRNSQEYIDAFAQYIKSGDDEEIRALLTENVSGTVPVPEFVYDVVKTAWTKDGIMNLVRKSYLKGNLKVGYEIASSGAVIHQEGGDPIDEEQLTLGIVHLVPRNIKKYIAISDELYDLSSRDFLTYVYSELTYQIAKKCGETLIERIVSLSTQSNVPVVEYIDSAITTSTVAMALSKLSDEAVNPVVVMNKGSWGFFKKEQYDNKFGVDVFEGLPVVFNNALKPYNEATTGETFAIVGDFGNGALANYPNGEEVLLKTDELTLAQQDLIKIIGRQYVAVDVVAPKHFAVVNKGDEVTPIVPTGNIEITENTAEGETLNIAQYATATVNVSGGGGGLNLLHTTLNITCSEDSFGPMTSIDHFFDVIPCAIIDNNEITPLVETDLLKDYIPTLEAGASYTIDLYYVNIDSLQIAIKSPTLVTVSNLNNISFVSEEMGFAIYAVTDTTTNSSITLTVKTTN